MIPEISMAPPRGTSVVKIFIFVDKKLNNSPYPDCAISKIPDQPIQNCVLVTSHCMQMLTTKNPMKTNI